MSQTTSIGKTRPIINTGKRTICYLYRYCILSKNIHRFSILLSINKGIPLQCDLIVFDFSFRKSIIKLKFTRMWHWVFWWNIHIIFLFCWLTKQSLTFKGVNTKSIWYLCFCDIRNVNLRQQKANWQHWRVTRGLQASPLTWKVAPINIHACIHYDYDITLMTERTF